MKYIFLVILLMPITMIYAQTATQYKAVMTERLTNAKSYTLAVAAAMPEDAYGFKPAEDEMSFGQQLLHIADNLRWISGSYLGASVSNADKPDAMNKTAVINWQEKAWDVAITAVNSLPENELATEVDFFAGTKTKMQMINLLNDHQAHHRGQLVVYLRLQGIKPPRYIGW